MTLKSGGGITIFKIQNPVCPHCNSRQTGADFQPGIILWDKYAWRGWLVYEIHNYEPEGEILYVYCLDCSRRWPAKYTERWL